MGTCNGCGRCCDPVVLHASQLQVGLSFPTDDAETEANREFILTHLHPMNRREGLRLADYLTAGVTVMGLPGTPGSEVFVWSMFYSCDFYDRDTKQCGAYDRRPPMCSGYPWYGEPPDPRKAIPPECSYLEDIPVTMRRRPPR